MDPPPQRLRWGKRRGVDGGRRRRHDNMYKEPTTTIDLPVLTSIVWRLPGVVDVRNHVRPTEPNPEPPQSSHPISDYEYLRYFR